jgi:hypothetical protein
VSESPTNPPRNGEGDRPQDGGGVPRNGEGDRPQDGGGGPPRNGEGRTQPEILQQPFKQVRRARTLRKAMSLPQVLLWRELKKRPGGYKFRKEFPFHPYTVTSPACHRGW